MNLRHHALQAFAGILLCLGTVYASAQQSSPADPPTLAQAEHTASDLKQGMSTDDVQKLLGAPLRTSLHSDMGVASKPSRGTLQWTYTWRNSSLQGSLRVDFTQRATEDWSVVGWEWMNY